MNAGRSAVWVSGTKLLMTVNALPTGGTQIGQNITGITLTYWYWNGSAWVSGTPTQLNTIGAQSQCGDHPSRVPDSARSDHGHIDDIDDLRDKRERSR